MDIEYMIQVKNNPVINFKNEPMAISDIEKLEKKYNKGNEFPKAFREFLFLAGDFNNFAFDDLGEGMDKLQEIANKELDRTNQKVDRPFFAFDVYDSCYSVIFLDETNDDPNVYHIDVYGAKEGAVPLVQIPTGGFKENYTFTELVNESIRRVKYNIAF